jgi:hypothetical protein
MVVTDLHTSLCYSIPSDRRYLKFIIFCLCFLLLRCKVVFIFLRTEHRTLVSTTGTCPNEGHDWQLLPMCSFPRSHSQQFYVDTGFQSKTLFFVHRAKRAFITVRSWGLIGHNLEPWNS